MAANTVSPATTAEVPIALPEVVRKGVDLRAHREKIYALVTQAKAKLDADPDGKLSVEISLELNMGLKTLHDRTINRARVERNQQRQKVVKVAKNVRKEFRQQRAGRKAPIRHRAINGHPPYSHSKQFMQPRFQPYRLNKRR